ncbi:B3 domain-containing protein [Cardamine amara subsp. amara]|uniref:B3 domain-containing protein n=1 Tax=Cardamine amara subsp. amara TaxID=228776 RepID=A0ABD0ZD57_CARAN
MNYSDFAIDPAMIISKELSRTDVVGNITLPKTQVISVLTKMKDVTDSSLQNGIEVQVHDLVENDVYTVTLRCVDKTKYYFGSGWSTMKHSLDLKEGDVLKLYWDYLNYKFILLNLPYSLIMD